MINVKDYILPSCFFLLLVFINKTNLYGFLLLVASLTVYFKNPKITIILLFLWTILILKKSYEAFQTEAKVNTEVTTPSIPTTTISNKSSYKIFAKIKNQNEKFPFIIRNNNTFNDIRQMLETITGINLKMYNIGFKITAENGDEITYYLNDTESNQIISWWNKYIETENKKANPTNTPNINVNPIQSSKLEFRHKYKLPRLRDGFDFIFNKITSQDRLIFLFKNLTLLSDNELIRNILFENNIDTPDKLAKLEDQKVLNSTGLKNIRNFGFIFPIPGFEDTRIIKLIKSNPDMELTRKENTIKKLEELRENLSFVEQEGFDFYKGISPINDKYYVMLDIIGINKLFAVETILEIINSDTFQNVETLKELNYIALMFKLNNILDDVGLKDTGEAWKLRGLQTLAKFYNTKFGPTNEILNKYNIKTLATSKLYNKKIELDKSLTLDFDLINLSNSVNQTKEFRDKTYENEVKKQKNIEFEKLGKINNAVNIYEQQRNKNTEIIEIDKLEKMMANVGLDIINELVELFGVNGDESFQNYIEMSDAGLMSEESNKFMLYKYLYTFKQIAIILTKEGRMFYVGFFMLIISILVYFIEISK